jgi:penicillin-binding protein 1B
MPRFDIGTRRPLAIAAGAAAALALAVFAAALIQLASIEIPSDHGPEAQPDGPSRLYARPLSLRAGAHIGADALEAYLIATGYRKVETSEVSAGEYAVAGSDWRIGARAFRHAAGDDPGGDLTLRLSSGGRVAWLRDGAGETLRERWLEPAVLASFLPRDGRDQRRVRLDALPSHLIDAVLAIEDHRFLEHGGLDLRRIGGALVANLRAGRIVQGGSTLTQQLVKNLYLSRERSWFRKLQEVPLALLLELRRSKREILEAYLNEVYLGQSGGVAIHGVGAAAEHWFGRPVEALALHESALLAGMLRGPSLYSPWRDPQAARARRDRVLARMVEVGSLSPDALDAARARPLGVIAGRRVPRSARYFADTLLPDLTARYAEDELTREGLALYTTLDLRLQRIAEEAVQRGVAELERATPTLVREDHPLQAALVAVDPKSGSLLAMVGGRSYGDTQFNRASEARRQPGSVFKPVAALAALTAEDGEPPAFTLASLVEDAPIALATPEGEWRPENHDGAFHGHVTLRQVVEHSLNVPMVRVGVEIGPQRVVRAARRLGIESPLHGVPSLVLGTSEVTLEEITRAYAVLAADGWRAAPRAFAGARDAAGHELERSLPEGSQALDPAEAYLLTSLLEGVVNRGTGYGVRALGFSGPVAGKTGTTDDYRDAWFVGYTPELAAGVWVGFDDGRTLRHSGSRAALPIFAAFIREALGPAGGRGFQVPDGVQAVAVVASAEHRSGLRCFGDREVFLADTVPQERCDPFDWLFSRGVVRARDLDAEPIEPEPQPLLGARDATLALPPVGADAEPPPQRRLRLPWWMNPFGRPVER